jgi:hypothetical protein
MLDQVVVFSKTGVVIWSKAFAKIKPTLAGESPVNALVRTILLEDKGAGRSATIEGYALKWTLANEFDIVIVVVYQKVRVCLFRFFLFFVLLLMVVVVVVPWWWWWWRWWWWWLWWWWSSSSSSSSWSCWWCW